MTLTHIPTLGGEGSPPSTRGERIAGSRTRLCRFGAGCLEQGGAA
jgi:hypothetical protein